MHTHSHVKDFFQLYPEKDHAFETHDGVLHGDENIANKWVQRHGNKTIKKHINSKMAKETAAKEKTTPVVPPGKPAEGGKPAPKPRGGGKPNKVNEAKPPKGRGKPDQLQAFTGEAGQSTGNSRGDSQAEPATVTEGSTETK